MYFFLISIYPIKKHAGYCIAGGCSDSEFETGVCTMKMK